MALDNQTFANLERDIDDTGKFVNTKGVITPREGIPFKSAPLIAEEAELKADEVVAKGFYLGFANEAAMRAYTPSFAETRAKLDDTKKVYRWQRTSAEGVTPITGIWHDTGLSELDQAKIYTDLKTRLITPAQISNPHEVNVLKTAVFRNGYIDHAGNIIPANTVKYSDYIAAHAGSSYEVSAASRYIAAEYDADFNFLRTIEQNSSEVIKNVKFTLSQNTAYIRINIYNSDTLKTLKEINPSYNLNWLHVDADHIFGLEKQVSDLLNPQPNIFNQASFTTGFFLGSTDNPIANVGLAYSDFIEVNNEKLVISQCSRFVGHYYDINKNYLGYITTNQGNMLNDFVFDVPVGAKFLRVNKYLSDPYPYLRKNNIDITNAVQAATKTSMKNKTVFWCGTSIPAGHPHHGTDAGRDVYSYANKAVHDLGGRIINKCVSGGYISEGITDAAKRWFVSNEAAVNYQNSLLNLFGTDDEPDLIVFDYGVNDYRMRITDFISFDYDDQFSDDPSKTRIDTRNKSTFIGAHNTIIDAVLAQKPDAKFAFVSHFSLDSGQPAHAPNQTNYYKKLCLVQQAIAEYWVSPFFRIYEKSGFRSRNNNNNIIIYMPDQIHPASGDGRAVQALTDIVRSFLNSVA